MTPLLVGLDLSLTCTGCIAAPLDWGGDWSKVTAREYSAAPLPKLKRGEARELTEVERFSRIAHLGLQVSEWCWNLHGRNIPAGVDRATPAHVWIEERAMSKQNRANGQTAELHAVVKFQLARMGIDFRMVPSTECRKLLLGNVPRRGDDAKDAVQATLRAAGCPIEWGQDLTDAGCVLNFAMVINGGYGFSTPRAA